MRHIQAQGPMILSHVLSEIYPLSGGDTEQHHQSGGWNVLGANVLYWVSKAYLHYRISVVNNILTHLFFIPFDLKALKKKYLSKTYIKASKTNTAYDLIKA